MTGWTQLRDRLRKTDSRPTAHKLAEDARRYLDATVDECVDMTLALAKFSSDGYLTALRVMVPILADTDAVRTRVARAGLATRAAEEAVYEERFYKDRGPDPGVAGVVVLLATGADDAEVRGWSTSRCTGSMDWTALVTAFAEMGDRVDGATAPGRIAAIQALAGCAADELIYEFVLRPDGPGGSAGLGSQCTWIVEFWPDGATAINESLVRWAGYALGDAQWSNSSIAHACVAASRRMPHRAIDLRLALEMCQAADSVNFDEAAPELGIAMAYDVSVDEVVALNGSNARNQV